jgi:peptide/nickel transport system ATP-binding protein
MSRDLPRGEIPDAADPPLGCSFHPRCPAAFGPCGWEPRDVRMVLEQRWTTVSAEQFEAESRLVHDGPQFASADHVHAASGSPGEVLALLEDERAERPDDPLWKGVAGMTVEGRSVRIDMRPAVDPPLEPDDSGPVSVACHLFNPPEGYARGGRSLDDPRASSNEAGQ